MIEPQHSIKAVSKRTGLSPHVIRIWEKRYGAVTPARSQTKRRLYSESEIQRLELLRQATQLGHSIGNIATVSDKELQELVARFKAATPANPPRAKVKGSDELVEAAIEAIRAMDSRMLAESLEQAVVQYGIQGMLQQVTSPLAERIGDLWRQGEITAGHEHFASWEIRMFLANINRPFSPNESTPVLIAATPSGQLHELGLVMVSTAATNLGWHVIYLGTSLPPAEIAGAARQNRARAVALSIVFPEDDPRLGSDLDQLRQFLDPEVQIIAGGRAAEAYSEALRRIGAVQLDSLNDFTAHLEALRRESRPAGPPRSSA